MCQTNITGCSVILSNSLAKNQASSTADIKHNLDEIEDLANQMNESVQQSKEVVKNFSESFSTVRNKAEENKQSVLNISKELDKFML